MSELKSRFVSSERHTAPARLSSNTVAGFAPRRDLTLGLRPSSSMLLDARLQGKRQAENVHFDVDQFGKVSVFIFTDTPPPDLRCVICWELFKDPVITPCGHTLCRECITQELNSSGRCPVDRRLVNVSSLASNLLAKTLVEELDTHCTYGCVYDDQDGWTLDLHGCPDTVKFHLRKAHQKGCEYAPVRCPYGGDRCQLIPRMDLEEHMEDDCPHNLLVREEEERRKKSEIDPLEAITILVVWSLIMFGLLQTEFLGGMLRKASGPLSILIGFPVGMVFILMIVEYWYHSNDVNNDDDED